jgi:hypothetical protein
LPYTWRTPRLVFVNSMSDLFHARVPLAFVRQVIDVMRDTPQHTYQVLTKRSRRLARLADHLDWPKNVWMGVSVESSDFLGRVDELRRVPAAVRFLSCEPLLGPLEGIDLDGIGWVIAGTLGSGPVGPRLRSASSPPARQRACHTLTAWGETPSWRATSAWRTPMANSSPARSRRACSRSRSCCAAGRRARVAMAVSCPARPVQLQLGPAPSQPDTQDLF